MSAAQELADLRALLDDDIIDQDEYDAKLKEINEDAAAAAAAAPQPPKKKARKSKAKPEPKAGDYEALSCAKLKALSKERGCAATGEKGVLVWRLKLKDAAAGLTLPDGRCPFALRGGALKKAAAQAGTSPMGSPEEMLDGIVQALLKHAPAKPALEQNDGGAGASRKAAARVLELADEDDWEGILALGAPGREISAKSPVNELRKAYRRLCLVVHPDKLRGFDGATRAFQAVVTALDRVTNPEAPGGEEDDGYSGPALERTNEGCVRTRVRCPRCDEPWGESKNEGLPDYSYTLLMTGLRSYTCSTCLCEFGAASATHACKQCGGEIDYSPADFHRKIQCGDCGAEFGFWSYHISDRARREAVQDARRRHEERSRNRAAKKRRADRAGRGPRGDLFDAETAFLMDLTDHCPRCGEFFAKGSTREDKVQHLKGCDDAAAHAAHAAAQRREKAKHVAKEARADAEDDARARAVWEASGARTTQLWMLPDSTLAEMAGAPEGLDRVELINRAAAARDAGRLITDGGEGAGKAKRRKLTAKSLPENYAALSVDELLAVCAAHGFAPAARSKDALLH
eukprot:CAMPEP_0119293542 /NCGR_PEP_ID=MMETSP1329-20130426/46286_1 /TAXON_ID=114041 /ORGANISM="Genus nov. species nov., Strain RCC1024" /LENGTH=572 /DNA_ID=CAMNT_0007294415 /DNA_START=112 /DNA_END=1827 /DNA_ORIENTATION=+